MATSQGVNVLRYSALFFGVFYGFYHQSSLNAQAKAAQIDRDYHRKEQLIEQAKAEFARKNSPASKEPEAGVITDPNDARFDLEAFLKMQAGEK
ncbi:F1F0 ATP synthase subunit e, mitochondrial [Emydomyces testavorans]|uniref:ATP synthase F(0) complex subunit e, mitochondrial n=1 Tax=Emydomyces testavorans TaxID=2070801 RepID=A0AAF0IL32_9EURO|nr:F1F0 ATP synthase subunit e, mitochondrial [Emydomyces testavorans]